MTGILFALIAASGWGSSAVFTKIALEKIDTRLGTIVSLFFSTIVMFTISLATQIDHFSKLKMPDMIWFFAAGVFTFSLGRLLNYTGISFVGVSKSTPLVGTSTLFATIFAILLLGEKPSPLIGIGVLLVTIGIIFITKSK
jgi:transporter family protein